MCPSNHDAAAIEVLEVEGVHRLTHLEHHVVRDVNDNADWPDAGRPQPSGHPGRRARHIVDALDQTANEAPAPVQSLDRCKLRRHWWPVGWDRWRLQRDAKDGADLPGDSEVAKEIRTV